MPSGHMPSGGLMEQVHLREYIRVLRKHAWLILACFVVVVGTVGIGTFMQRPVYRAVTRALIAPEAPRVVNIQEVAPAGGDSAELFQTQIQIIRSRPVIQRVVDTLGLLSRKPELAAALDPTETFLKSVSVEPVRNTRLVDIQVDDPDPKLAAEMANALASAYVHQNLELKFGAARDALTWLTAQAQELRTKVNESELTLQTYREQAGLVSAEEKQSLAAKKLAEFNAGYIEAKAKRLEMESRLAEMRRSSQQPELLESSPLVINNPLIQRLKGQLVELEVQRSKLLKTYRDKHPEVVKVQSQIDEIAQKIREEISRLALSMESEYNALKARESAMLQAVNQYRDEAQGLAKKEIRYGILKREVDSNQQLYDVLLKRLKETGLSQGLDSNNVRIVEPAVAPIRPVKPRKLLNLAIGVVLGLLTGVALAFFVEYMDDTIRSPEHVEQAIGVPVFALIPVVSARGRS
jgi:succinoglycan biosynthesis transport protein ExoP